METDGVGVADVDALKGSVSTVRLSRSQRLVAERMVESKTAVPDFTVAMDVCMDNAVALRERRKRETSPGDVAPSLNDIVIKACASALRAYPRANASFGDGVIEMYDRINIGVAVAAEDSLTVPVVMDADRKTVDEIAQETRRLVGRVRDRTITPSELQGATFTVSNLGMAGVRSFTAVINPPQAAIVAVGAVRSVLEDHDGEIVSRKRAELTLTSDHRVLYGAHAAALLGLVRDGVEEPAGG